MRSAPLIVGITTLPRRISRVRTTLESLLNGSLRPDAIKLIVPEKALRDSGEFQLPDFLLDPAFHDDVVQVVRIPRDFGPGSKLLGALGEIAEPSCLIIADDDVKYRPDFVSNLWQSQMQHRDASFSFYVYPVGGIDVGQGCDGFSFWTPNLSGVHDFFSRYVDGTDLMFHDDLWISFFLASKDIPVRSLRNQLGGGLIYEQVFELDALRNLEGELHRDRLTAREYRRLRKVVEMPGRQRLKIGLKEARRELVMKNLSRIANKARQINKR